MPCVWTPLSMHVGAGTGVAAARAGVGALAAGTAAAPLADGGGTGVVVAAGAVVVEVADGAAPATVNTNCPSLGSPSSPETLCHSTVYMPGPSAPIGTL